MTDEKKKIQVTVNETTQKRLEQLKWKFDINQSAVIALALQKLHGEEFGQTAE